MQAIVIFGVLAAVFGMGGTAIILTMFTLYQHDGGKLSFKKWYKKTFELGD